MHFMFFFFFNNNHTIVQMEWVKCGAFIRLAGEAAGIKETNASLLRGRRHAFASMMDGCGLTAELICIMHPHRVIDQR